MFCTKCGKKVKEGSVFCPSCGQKIAAAPKSEISSGRGGNPIPSEPKKGGTGAAWKVAACIAAAGTAAVVGFGAVWLTGGLGGRDGSEKTRNRENSVNVSDQREQNEDPISYGEATKTPSQADLGQPAEGETTEPVNPDVSESETMEAGSQPVTTEAQGEAALASANVQEPEYILPESNSRYMTYYDLQGLDEATLRIAKNEIFARHGRLFQSEDLDQYFRSKSWYQGTIAPNDFSERVFNEFEKGNVALTAAFQNGISDGEYKAHDFMIVYFQMHEGVLTVIANADNWGNSLEAFAFSLPVSGNCNWWYVNENRAIAGKDAELSKLYKQKRAEYLQSPDTYQSPTSVTIIVKGGTVTEVKQYNP